MSLNDFVIMQKVGSGSFAQVYKARRVIDQQVYALKKIGMKALGIKQKNNALNEIRLLACLNSPYIISYCESFFDEKLDLLCIAMEYADEGDLLKKVQKHKKLHTLIPEVEVWRIFIHLLYGLNQLHQRSILHRDLKSQNVFISNGIYKIGDMNVSKILKNGLASTQTGTPYYASPEVWNDQPYNDKSDVWSLGCILYELTALRPPYEASSMQKLFYMISKYPVPKIPTTYSRQIQNIINCCLEKNPLHRLSIKQLLENQTVKIYENMLIQFKPSVKSNSQQSLLKTIYMPSSKKELKHKLPQSNYKSNHKSDAKSSESKESLQKPEKSESFLDQKNKIKNRMPNENVRQKRQCQKSQQKSPLYSLQNQIKIDDNSFKHPQLPKGRRRINSCQLLNNSKQKSTSKENLKARVQHIINSHHKSKNAHKQVMINSAINKISQKQSANSQCYSHQLPLQNLSRGIYIDDEQIVVPKKLIFTDSDEKMELKIASNVQSFIKTEKDGTNLSETKEKKNQALNILPKQLKIPEQIIKNPYLLDTIANNYQPEPSEKSNQESDLSATNNLIRPNDCQLQSLNQANNIMASPLTNSENLISKNVNIRIDINENKFITKIENKQELTEYCTINFILGFEKVKNIINHFIFKFKLSSLNYIQKYNYAVQLKDNSNDTHIKQYQDRKIIIEQKILVEPNITAILTTPLKADEKRNRSRSIRKTQKYKQIQSTEKKSDQDGAGYAIIQKINKKLDLNSSNKKGSRQKPGNQLRKGKIQNLSSNKCSFQNLLQVISKLSNNKKNREMPLKQNLSTYKNILRTKCHQQEDFSFRKYQKDFALREINVESKRFLSKKTYEAQNQSKKPRCFLIK